MFLLGDKVFLAHNVALGTMPQGYVYIILLMFCEFLSYFAL